MSGVEDHLLQEGYFLFRGQPSSSQRSNENIRACCNNGLFEGLIAVDTGMSRGAKHPVVAVSGHRDVPE